METTKRLRRCAARFAALGLPVRLLLVRALLRAHPTGLIAGALQKAVDIPASTLSHHLGALLEAALVEQTREGRFLRYRVADAALRELITFMLEECCTARPVVPLSALTARKR